VVSLYIGGDHLMSKSCGGKRGRPPIEVDKSKFEIIYGRVQRGEITNNYAMKLLGLKRNTYYKFVKYYTTRTGRWANET